MRENLKDLINDFTEMHFHASSFVILMSTGIMDEFV